MRSHHGAVNLNDLGPRNLVYKVTRVVLKKGYVMYQDHVSYLCPVCSRELHPVASDERSIIFTPAVILEAEGSHELCCELQRLQQEKPKIVCVFRGHVHIRGTVDDLQLLGALFAIAGAKYHNPYLYYYAEIILGYRQERIRKKIAYVGKPEPAAPHLVEIPDIR